MTRGRLGAGAARAGIAAVLASLATLQAGGGAAACEARVVLDPEVAFVGQQVRHEIVVSGVATGTSLEWIHPPEFPDATATLLRPAFGRPSDPPDIRRQRRALHPARPGRLRLPATPFLCWPATGEARMQVSTPAVSLEVKPAPTLGRPAEWRGLVGPASLTLVAPRTPLHVGDTLELVATLRGEGRVRQAAFAWPEAALRAGPVAAELFPAPPLFREQTGPRLVGRRVERIEIVPHAPGILEVPAISVDLLDPATGRFVAVSSEPVRVEVLAAAPAPRRGGAAASEDASERDDTHTREAKGGARRVVAALLVAAAIGGLAIARRRGWRSGDGAAAAERRAPR